MGSIDFRSWAVVALAIVSGGQTGCWSSKACTLIGCGNSFQVPFQPAAGHWSPGRYDVTVVADGASGICTVTLPFDSCASAPVCTGADGWSVLESGCALAPELHAIAGVTFTTTPKNVQILISLDGRQVASGSFVPTYKVFQPNGPDCEPTCSQAVAATLVVQP